MFDFVDLFAGIGGFHAALASLGGNAVQAAEIDPRAAAVYERNWQLRPDRDVRELADDPEDRVRDHVVLAGGFPCQPFSKSGRQLGMGEERGTLFHDIVRILEVKRPPVVFLENVRNIAGRNQKHTWRAVVDGLRRVGYQISDRPLVFSPHLLPPDAGGAAQVRDRVYILGTYVGPERALKETAVGPVLQRVPQLGWDPSQWSIAEHVIAPAAPVSRAGAYRLTTEEHLWVDTWNDLLARLGTVKLPGHPLWSDVWVDKFRVDASLPVWKQDFLRKNVDFYREHRPAIRAWRRANPQLRDFPESRRKLEWQAQAAPRDLWQLLLHFRPSGIRAKQPTYAPALVAMGQTSVYGPERRRLTPRETAVLQGFDPDFKFGPQVDSLSYRQLGNAVNVGTAAFVLSSYVEANADLIENAQDSGAKTDGSLLVKSVESALEQRSRDDARAG